MLHPKFPSRAAWVATLFALPLLFAPNAWPAPGRSCLRLLDNLKRISTDVSKSLAETDDWEKIIAELSEGVDPHSRQPFGIQIPGAAPGHGAHVVTPAVSHFKEAKLEISRDPRHGVPAGGAVVRAPKFGYDLPDGFREIGPLNYLVVDANDVIREVGAPSRAAMDEFFRHLEGYEFTEAELARVSDLNMRLLDALRKHEPSRRKLAEFASARKWPAGLADEAKLAYFDPTTFNIADWAKRNGFSNSELIDAGWYRLDFDRSGKSRFTVNSPDSIKIPYLAADGKGVPVWRSRNLAKNKPGLPKYTGWQIDRSVNRRLSVAERLFNGARLGLAKGKPILITEGEFKCLVAEKITGIPTFGIPGITEFDDEMIRALVNAEGSEYIVVLDRDPHGKALFRADEVTDSNRAAYQLAKDLQRLGAPRVRVGTLPELAGGEKLGIDDLVLKYGTAPILKTIDEAAPPKAYAERIGLNPEFQELMRRRSRLRKAVTNRKIADSRRGMSEEIPALQSAGARLKILNRTFSNYLENELNAATSLSSASGKVNSIRAAADIPAAAGKTARLSSEKTIPLASFRGDVLLLDYVPADFRGLDCRPGPCGQLPYSRNDLKAAWAGVTPEGELAEVLRATPEITKESSFKPQSFEEFSALVLAAHLTRSFPFDEYRYEFGLRLMSAGKTSATLPLTIVKRNSEAVVGIANLHVTQSPEYWKRVSADFAGVLGFLRGQ